jgi:hypothetical protein
MAICCCLHRACRTGQGSKEEEGVVKEGRTEWGRRTMRCSRRRRCCWRKGDTTTRCLPFPRRLPARPWRGWERGGKREKEERRRRRRRRARGRKRGVCLGTRIAWRVGAGEEKEWGKAKATR